MKKELPRRYLLWSIITITMITIIITTTTI